VVWCGVVLCGVVGVALPSNLHCASQCPLTHALPLRNNTNTNTNTNTKH